MHGPLRKKNVLEEVNSREETSSSSSSSSSSDSSEKVAESESSDCKTSGLASLFAGFFRCPTNKSEDVDSAEHVEELDNAQNTSNEAGAGV